MNIVNDKVTEYLDSFYRPVNDFLKILRAEAEEKGIPIIQRDTEACILNLIRIKNPRRILEIGTAAGYSAICFAAAFPQTEIVSLEVNKDLYGAALTNIEKCGLSDRIHVKLGDAVESLRELGEAMSHVDSAGFDLVFIDAAKSHYKKFWDGSIPLCREGAMILSDNVLLKGRTASDEYVTEKRQKTSVRRMREYIKYITKSGYADTAVLPLGDGIAVSVLRGKNGEN